MSHDSKIANLSDGCLSRRHWIALAVSTLVASCGGGADSGTGTGSSSQVAGTPGTGGTGIGADTGIYSRGTIAGFGSVIVNGVKFDDVGAAVQINGIQAPADDLRLGMVAGVTGSRYADMVTGRADHIEVWSIARGPITATNAGQFSVMGMTVLTASPVVLDGVGGLADLKAGQVVQVWGLQADAIGRSWTATRVAVVQAPALQVSTGWVVVDHGQRLLNGLLLTGAKADTLRNGQLIRVEGMWDEGAGTLSVDRVTEVSIVSEPGSGIEVEIEGVVTSLQPGGHLTLGSLNVDASATALGAIYAQLKVGSRVEIYGGWQGQTLKASKIELEDEASEGSVEIEGSIQSFTSVSNFVVRNQRCDASGATRFEGGTASNLRQGVRVHVKGTIEGNVLKVSSVEF
jgi:hypothetical protein